MTYNPAGLDTSIASTTSPGSPWVVVNKRNPLDPLGWVPPGLTSVGHGQTMISYAAHSMNPMLAAAARGGIDLYVASGYRSYGTQKSVHASSVQRNGQEKADEVSARAGYSEHQSGWSADVATSGCVIEDCFASTAAGRWVAVHAWEYGFVVRYPDGRQETTGYTYEPWHVRYVGPKLATAMHRKGITALEDALGYPAAPTY